MNAENISLRWIGWSLALFLSLSCWSGEIFPAETIIESESSGIGGAEVEGLEFSEGTKSPQNDSWWEQRNKRIDLYYPHNLHSDVMKKAGDSCMSCHSFSANEIVDEEKLSKVNVIANEPLKAICHECHVVQLMAPWECDLCHQDRREIWPDDHHYDYVNHHRTAAQLDDGECSTCHIDVSFCSDCHFRRDPIQREEHTLGYRKTHGLEARMNGGRCGSCHGVSYCQDCHRIHQ